MRFQRIFPVLVALVSVAAVNAADLYEADGNGRIIGLKLDDATESFQSDVVFALPGWSQTVYLGPGSVAGVKFDRFRNTRTWTGRVRISGTKSCMYTQTITEVDGSIRLHFEAMAEEDVNLASVVFFFRLRDSMFGGGTAEMTSNGVFVSAANIPVEQGSKPHFLFGIADRISLASNTAEVEFVVQSDVPRYFIVQDERNWNSPTYALYTEFHRGPMKKGEVVMLDLKISVKGKADHSPVRLSVNPGRIKYKFAGMGGNFVFALDSPVAKYSLENLRLAWGRTQMNLLDWAPSEASSTETNLTSYWSRDLPHSELRREFLMATSLTRHNIPYIISIWYLPEWMYLDPGQDKETYRRRIDPEKWDEILDSIGSYLLYAKRQYGTEPALFSFNESREGVHILMTPEEHRDAIIKIGSHFSKLGLKTKMLLGDVATVADTVPFAIPTEIDPVARTYTSAVGVHTWNGATPEQYAAWGDFAARLHKPLLFAEVGTDPYAWHTPWCLQNYGYAMRELKMYQDLLTYAMPQSLLPWELTGDYPTVRTRTMSDGSVKFMPTARFWFIKHFANLTPANADCITSDSTSSNLQVTAFTAAEGNIRRFVFHIANFGGARSVTLSGFPETVQSFVPVVTAEDGGFVEGTAIKTVKGSVLLDVKGMSLTTLSGTTKQ